MNGQDRVLDHTREQLSALFDGELALDEARFLQRRLQHDASLAGCVSRWQAIGAALRGEATGAMAPAGFAERVAAAMAAEAAPLPARRAGLLRRGWAPGAALAASVALVAFFATRQSPAPSPAGEAPQAQVAQASVPDPAAAAPTRVPSPPAPQVPGQEAAQLAAAVAVAEVPRRVASRRAPAASRGQAQRAATTRAARSAAPLDAQPQYAVAAATAPAGATLQSAVATDNPFAPSAAVAQQAVASRPWPRALLPNAGGAFNVGYGSLQGGTVPGADDTSHPFRPRVVAAGQATQETP